MRHAIAIFVLGLILCAGCGTYSMVRPANTLPKGKAEVAAGLAGSQLGEVNTILHAAYGVTDEVEVLAQNEIWNSFVEGRYGFLHDDEDHPIALAAGVGVGYAVTLVSAITEGDDPDQIEGGAGMVSVAAGHDWGRAQLTLGNRTFFLGTDYIASSTRLGLRLEANEHFGFMIETGATLHTPTAAFVGLFLAEASLGFWIGF